MPSNASGLASRCISAACCSAISAAVIVSTSPASAPRSISPRGWRRSPAGCIARWWRRRRLRKPAPAIGLILANFPSLVFPGRSACSAWPTRRRFKDEGCCAFGPSNAASLLSLGREQQGIALGAAGVGGACRLGFGDVLGEDRDHAYPALMRRDHDLVGLVLGHAELRRQDADDKLARCEVVVNQNNLVQ